MAIAMNLVTINLLQIVSLLYLQIELISYNKVNLLSRQKWLWAALPLTILLLTLLYREYTPLSMGKSMEQLRYWGDSLA